MVEPIIVDYCILLANMGAPLSREQVILLADSSIYGAEHRQKLIDFKSKRHLVKRDSVSNDSASSIIGSSWYAGFMRRNNSKIVSKLGVIKDIKRHTWCVYETFECMYKNVYEKLVEANIAAKLDEPVLFDINGSIVTDKALALGLPTRYKVMHPKYFLFVDETGKNTNMKHRWKHWRSAISGTCELNKK